MPRKHGHRARQQLQPCSPSTTLQFLGKHRNYLQNMPVRGSACRAFCVSIRRRAPRSKPITRQLWVRWSLVFGAYETRQSRFSTCRVRTYKPPHPQPFQQPFSPQVQPLLYRCVGHNQYSRRPRADGSVNQILGGLPSNQAAHGRRLDHHITKPTYHTPMHMACCLPRPGIRGRMMSGLRHPLHVCHPTRYVWECVAAHSGLNVRMSY